MLKFLQEKVKSVSSNIRKFFRKSQVRKHIEKVRKTDWATSDVVLGVSWVSKRYCMVNLCKYLWYSKQNYTGFVGLGLRNMDWKGTKKIVWDDRHVLNLDSGGDYLGLFILSSSSFTFTLNNFIVCILYLIKID